jgi:hypothetical protein
MITTQMRMDNRSEMVAVLGMPCVIPSSNSIYIKWTNHINNYQVLLFSVGYVQYQFSS